MDFVPEQRRRTLPHLAPIREGNQNVVVHVTRVVAKRRALLNRPEAEEILLNAWRRADHWMIGQYVIMPDHVHFLCAPAKFAGASLKKWMEFWRFEATRHWPWLEEKPVWQKDFLDRQLRSFESYSRKAQYI